MNNDNSKVAISTKNLVSTYNFDYLSKNVDEYENAGKNCLIY